MSSVRLNLIMLTTASITVVVSACDSLVPAPPEPSSARKPRSNGADAKNSRNVPLDPESWAKRIAGLNDNATKLAGQLTDINSQLSKLFAVKQLLCERQSELISSCIVHTPLSPSNWRQAAACKSERKIWDVRSFNVELQGMTGRFQIVLDNNIESNIFESERTQTLQWSARGSRSLRELKLSDVNAIKLRALDGNLDQLPQAKFKLAIDDKIIFTENDFLLSTRTDNAVMMSHLPLSEELSTASCRVDDDEIDQLVQQALRKADPPTVVTSPADKEDLTWEQRSKVFESWMGERQQELSTKTDVYLSAANDISRIRRDLRGELQLGCWGQQIIKTIEINIDGTHLPLSDWDRTKTSEALGTFANPTQTTIDFGGGLRFTNPDEDTLPLFRDGGRWLLNATTDLTIGDISSIQMQKGGYSYQSFKNCWSTWGGLSTACEWQNRESNRYRMINMSVKINGQLVYEKSGINMTFERSRLRWVEQELTANAAYINLMRRRDCPLTNSVQ